MSRVGLKAGREAITANPFRAYSKMRSLAFVREFMKIPAVPNCNQVCIAFSYWDSVSFSSKIVV